MLECNLFRLVFTHVNVVLLKTLDSISASCCLVTFENITMFTDRNWHIDSMWGVHRHLRRTQLLVFHKKMTDVSRLFWIHSLCDCIVCRSSVAFAVVGAAKWTSRIRAQGRSSDTQAKVIFHLPFLLFSFLFIFCTLCTNFRVALPPYLHLATSEMWCWSGGRGILKKKTLCVNSIVYYYNGAQRYEQFL